MTVTPSWIETLGRDDGLASSLEKGVTKLGQGLRLEIMQKLSINDLEGRMTTKRVCERCGQLLEEQATVDASVCAACSGAVETSGNAIIPKNEAQEKAADFLWSFLGPRHEGQKLGRGSVIGIGVITILVATGAGALVVLAVSAKDIGLPPEFIYGMFVLAGICLLISVACFFPRTRSWSLPLIAVFIGLVFLVLRWSKRLRQ